MRKSFSTLVPLLLLLGCDRAPLAPAADNAPAIQAGVGRVTHRVTVGGPDACVGFEEPAPPGCDANFSLVALQGAGGVTGEWHDQFAQVPGIGGIGIHAVVNCVLVIGNQAWIGGVVTQTRIPFPIIGLDVVTRVVDNGKTANDLPDQISFSVIGIGIPCTDAPGYPLFDAPQGQSVVVQ